MRDVILTIVIFGLLPACFLRPWIGALTWAWLGFMNPHMLAWSFARGLPFSMLVAVATLSGLLLTKDRKPFPWTRETRLLVILAVYFTVTTVFAFMPDQAWHFWGRVMKILLMAAVTMTLIYGRKRIHLLLLIIALSIGFYGLKGGIFTFLTGGAYRIYGPDASFIGDNNSIGLAMIMVLPLLFWLPQEEPRKWMRWLLRLSGAFTAVAVVFTYSRGSLVGLLAIAPFLFMRSRHKLAWLVLVIPAAVMVARFAPEKLYQRAHTIEAYDQDRSAMQRFQAWSVSWNIAKSRPLLGGGFYLEYMPDTQWLKWADRKYDAWGSRAKAAHSVYFQVLGNHGFFAFTLFMFMLGFCFATLGRLRREAAKQAETLWISHYATPLQIGLLGYAVSGAFLNLAYFDLYYAFLALTVVLKREFDQCRSAKPVVKAPIKAVTAPGPLPAALTGSAR